MFAALNQLKPWVVLAFRKILNGYHFEWHTMVSNIEVTNLTHFTFLAIRAAGIFCIFSECGPINEAYLWVSAMIFLKSNLFLDLCGSSQCEPLYQVRSAIALLARRIHWLQFSYYAYRLSVNFHHLAFMNHN